MFRFRFPKTLKVEIYFKSLCKNCFGVGYTVQLSRFCASLTSYLAQLFRNISCFSTTSIRFANPCLAPSDLYILSLKNTLVNAFFTKFLNFFCYFLTKKLSPQYLVEKVPKTPYFRYFNVIKR